ncbi:Solute carrier family 35 member G1 [Holothuria leucospilota]|uniref:Solute carrier family 35 member G1 n=1 Tax=Holothuria leucospilota TaxID=206669 RepID=A0A9Q1BYS1_HOLLE|nr:Solute carrier family 35 member G1 [Holothuria leucospilota]
MVRGDEFVYEQNVVLSEGEDGHNLEKETRCSTTVELEEQDNKINSVNGEDNISAEENDSSCKRSLPICFTCVLRRYGILLALCAGISFSFVSLLLSILTNKVDSFLAVFLQSPVMFLGTAILLLLKRIPLPKDWTHYPWLLLSGMCLSSNLLLISFALRCIEVGDAVTIVYTSLLQVGLFSRIILREPLKVFDFAFAAVGFIGVIFITRPRFIFRIDDDAVGNDTRLVGVVCALCVSVTYALLLVVIRKQSMLGIHSFTGMCFNAAIVSLSSGAISVYLNGWHSPSISEWLIALGVGFTLYIAQLAMHYALRVECATLVNMICTTEILFAFVWQFLFLHVSPTWTSVVGAVFVMAACIGVSLKSQAEAESDTRIQQSQT